MVLATFLLLIGAILLFYIFAVFRHLMNKNSSEAEQDTSASTIESMDRHLRKQLRGLVLMSAVMIGINLAFLARLVVVYLHNLHPSVNFGDGVYYGAGTLLSETLALGLVLSVAFLSFYRFRKRKLSSRFSDRLLDSVGVGTSSDSFNMEDIPATYRDV